MPKVLELFATLLQYDAEPKRYTSFNHGIYNALPAIFMDYANGARYDSGFRLLRRCARHTMDPNARNLMSTDATLFLFGEEEELGIVLNNMVPASMKNVAYDAHGAFTKNKVIACKCTCPCGSEGDEALVDVHILPLALELSLLLIGGLAEHILLELSAHFSSKNMAEIFDEEEIRSMKHSIFVLMLAAGQQGLKSEDIFQPSREIRDILSTFSVGTENRKKMVVGPPDASKIGPLCDLGDASLVSVEKMVANQTTHLKNIGKVQGGGRMCASGCSHEVCVGTAPGEGDGLRCIPVQQRTPVCESSAPVLLEKIDGRYKVSVCGCCSTGMPTQHRCQHSVKGSSIMDPYSMEKFV